MYTAGSTPCAVGMSVGAITDDSGGLWSRGHPLGPEAGIRGGSRPSLRIAVGDILERKLSTFWAVPFPYDGTRWASTPGAHG